MRGRKARLKIRLSQEQRDELSRWLRCPTMAAGPVRRARAILLLDEDRSYSEVGRQLGMAKRHLHKWAKRFAESGVEGLYDKKRPGRKPVFSPRCSHASGEDGLRVAGSAGPIAVPLGLCGAGASADG